MNEKFTLPVCAILLHLAYEFIDNPLKFLVEVDWEDTVEKSLLPSPKNFMLDVFFKF